MEMNIIDQQNNDSYLLYYCIFLICQEKDMIDKTGIRDENKKIFIIFLLYGIVCNKMISDCILPQIKQSVCNFMIFVLQIITVLPELLQNKNNSYSRPFYLDHSDIVCFGIIWLIQLDTALK